MTSNDIFEMFKELAPTLDKLNNYTYHKVLDVDKVGDDYTGDHNGVMYSYIPVLDCVETSIMTSSKLSNFTKFGTDDNVMVVSIDNYNGKHDVRNEFLSRIKTALKVVKDLKPFITKSTVDKHSHDWVILNLFMIVLNIPTHFQSMMLVNDSLDIYISMTKMSIEENLRIPKTINVPNSSIYKLNRIRYWTNLVIEYEKVLKLKPKYTAQTVLAALRS